METCFICGESNSVVLEKHHLIPNRFNGPDGQDNLVTLCANCHRAVESMYDSEFWSKMPQYIDNEPLRQFDSDSNQVAFQILASLGSDIVDGHDDEVANIKISDDFTSRERRLFLSGYNSALVDVLELIDEVADEIDAQCWVCGDQDMELWSATKQIKEDQHTVYNAFACDECLHKI